MDFRCRVKNKRGHQSVIPLADPISSLRITAINCQLILYLIWWFWICFISAKLPTDKQHGSVKSQREEELKQRRSLYEWGTDAAYSDLPGFVKASGVKELPRDVQFTEEASYDLHAARRNALINMGLVHLFNIFDSWDDFDDYRKVFWLLWLTLTTATAAKTSLLKWLGFFKTLSRLFQIAENIKYRRISLELISWGPHSSFKRERKIRYRLFTSSIKREIRDFHAVVVQWRQRNVQKSVLHVQSSCFANLAYCFFDVLAAVAVVVAKAPYCVAGRLGRKNKKAQGTRGRKAFPSSHRPLRASYSLNYCYFYWNTQQKPLRRRELLWDSCILFSSSLQFDVAVEDFLPDPGER